MAVLATPDWLYNTRDNTMDIPTNSRQRTSPANESSSVQNLGLQQSQSQSQHQQTLHQQQQQQHLQQQQQQLLQQQQQMLLAAAQQHSQAAFTYQQQPHGSWTPNITAAPFYPSFFQNAQQQQTPQAYPGQMPPQAPYFDPANAQLAAQWAYQQMMFNAQHVFPQIPGQHHSPSQRPSSANQQGQPSSPSDYFAQNSLSPVFNPFPSGTPPPHTHRTPSGEHTQQGHQYPGFHPYRRPNRQQSQPHPPADSAADWRQGLPHPPYKRPDASGSSSSVSSSSSRQRTNSNRSVQSNGHNNNRRPSPVSASPATAGPNSQRSPPAPAGGPTSPSSQPANPSPLRQPHHRNSSTSSSTSTTTSIRPGALSPAPPTSSVSTTAATATSTTASSSNSGGSATPRLTRPSPLSQGTFTASEKRISRDDIDLGAMHDVSQSASSRSGGLKGRLRRALSFNTAQVLKEEEPIDEDDDASIKASQINNKMKGKASSNQESTFKASSSDKASVNANDSGVDEVSSTRAPTQPKKKNKAAALFNSRMNMSTDNISLSSTVSSASVMIRKLGAMGRLARRNSLAGIASLFKDKDKDNDGDKDKKGKKKDKKSAKAEASEASVSHVTAELDRMGGDWTVNSADLQGLTPAAKLARQHTLKSNAEAAAKAKEAAAAAAAREAEAASSSSKVSANGNGNALAAGVATWDRNTATRQQGSSSPIQGNLANIRVNEDGTRTLIEDDDDESDDGHYEHQQGPSSHSDGWDEDEDWDVDGDEDVTIRADLNRRSINSDDTGYDEQRRPSAEMEPWAMGVRRNIEKNIRPAKGILRNANSYDQNQYLQHDHATILNRGRSNSYTSTNANTEIGPLARMPSPDPDHIDGLRHNPHSAANRASPSAETPSFTLPPLSFDSSSSPLNASFDLTTPKERLSPASPIPLHVTHSHSENRTSAIYQNPTFNSSAPALSSIGSSLGKSPPTLAHRSQTAPIKQLTFASNLSVYDTFSATVYDRRSEPATWSRLTPVLAQRIKEELNSYKMEEMEVHAASRIHTQFFV